MFTKEELDILEDVLNEAIEEYLYSGYKITDEYIINVRGLLRKLNLREYWDYDKKYAGSDD